MARKSKKKFVISAGACMIAAGIFAILLSLLFLCSSGTRLSFLGGYVLSFLFGVVGYYAIPAWVILLALGLFHPKLNRFFAFRFSMGYLLLLLSSCVLSSLIVYQGQYGPGANDFSVYKAFFDEAGQVRFGYSTDVNLAGGLIGFGFVGLFPKDLVFIPYIIVSVIVLLGIFVMFFPAWKSVFRGFKASLAISRANRRQARQLQEQALLEQEHERETRVEMETVEEIPDDEVPPLPPKPINPLESLVFEPAKNTTPFPPRASRHQQPGQTQMQTQTPPPAYPETPYPHPSAPRDLPNPSEELYRGSKPRIYGLQEAFFDPNPTQESMAPQSPVLETPTPAPQPTPAMTTPVTRSFDAPTLEDLTPSFVPTANTRPNTPLPPEPQPTPAPQSEPAPQIFMQEDEPEPTPPPAVEPPPFMTLPLETEPTPVPPAAAPAPAQAQPQPQADEEAEVPLPPYQYPPVSLLLDPQQNSSLEEMERECQERIEIIDKAFIDLRIGAHVAGYTIGPSVTRFEIQPDANVSVTAITRIVKDIESRIGGVPIRYSERVAGLAMPAMETANVTCRTVSLKECFMGLPELSEKTRMYVPFGVQITGKLACADLTEFPHMLLAGTTGSGKSIFMHSMLLSLIMRNRPEELKLVLVDPKRVEMSKYRDIPHLLCPIIKEPVHAKNALKKLVEEMERRYRLFEDAAVQKISEYNNDYAPYYHKKKLPYILLVVDEFGDLVLNCKEVTEYVLALGAKARACGIHMIIATQRPDTHVIPGTIKANLPTAVALSVRSTVDSTVILGCGGAEDLAGHGDMLIDCAQIAKKEFVRAQGCFVDNKELRTVCDFIRAQQQVSYHPAFMDLDDKEDEVPAPSESGVSPNGAPVPPPPSSGGDDAKYLYIKSVIMTREFTSISSIQREFGVGFPRAGKIFARLQKEGIVDLTPISSSKGCRVLVHEEPSTSSAGSVSSSTVEPSWHEDPEEEIS